MWHELLFFICKPFKSLLVIKEIVVVNNWLTNSWYLNTNIFQIKFNRLLRKDNQTFLTPSGHFRIVFEVGLYNWHLFPTKPVLSATCDLQSVSAIRAVDTISGGLLMKGRCCLTLNDFPETPLIQTYRSSSPWARSVSK